MAREEVSDLKEHPIVSSTSHAHAVAVQPAGTVCRCTTEHSPVNVQMEHHHIWPAELGGPSEPENRVWICATAHNTVHVYLRVFLEGARVLPITGLRSALVERGYPARVHRYALDLAHQGFLWVRDQRIGPDNTILEFLR
jgi:hypothetical protein